MHKSPVKRLLKIILISTIGIFLLTNFAWAETETEAKAKLKARKISIPTLRIPTLRIPTFNINNRKPVRLNSGLTNFRGIPAKPMRNFKALDLNYSRIPRLAQVRSPVSHIPRINTNIQATRIKLKREAAPLRSPVLMPPRINTPAKLPSKAQRIKPTGMNISLRNPASRTVNIPQRKIPKIAIYEKPSSRPNTIRVNSLTAPRIPRIKVGTTNPLRMGSMNRTPSYYNTRINTSALSRVKNIRPTTILNSEKRATPNLRASTLKAPKINVHSTASPNRPTSTKIDTSASLSTRSTAIIRSAKGLNLLAKSNLPLQLPKNGGRIPVYPSRQREPISLPTGPIVPYNPNSQSSNNNTQRASSNTSSSGNHSGGSGIPLALPLMLGLCGQIPTSYKKAISRIVSEVSRRLQNGIGFMLAARSPNIFEVAESSLAFVHQMIREKQPVQPISVWEFFVFRSQAHCGLFCFLRVKNGR